MYIGSELTITSVSPLNESCKSGHITEAGESIELHNTETTGFSFSFSAIRPGSNKVKLNLLCAPAYTSEETVAVKLDLCYGVSGLGTAPCKALLLHSQTETLEVKKVMYVDPGLRSVVFTLEIPSNIYDRDGQFLFNCRLIRDNLIGGNLEGELSIYDINVRY